jgi:hypothetical protein
MNAFVVEMENRPGELARLAEAIADKGINITAIGAATSGSTGGIGFLTNDEEGTRQALDQVGLAYRSVELVAAALEDRPGTLAQAARRLADAGVNIELLLATGMSASRVTMAFGVDDASAARQALGELASVEA